MKIEPFALERYFARHEFSAKYLLSSSDCEALSMSALLEMADAPTRRMWDSLRLGYTDSAGHPLLREAVADTYTGIDRDQIQVLVPEEGIFLLMHALLKPGDHLVCTFPAYASLHEVARSIGCRVSLWEPVEARGWRFDLDRLEALLEPETRLAVVNFPHNPTGALPERAQFEALIDRLRPRGIRLLSDEMYRHLEQDPAARLPAACEIYEHAVSLSGLSKAFGLAGLRIGWLATRDRETLSRVAVLKDYTTICASAPSEVLALAALRNREQILTRQRERVRRNLEVLEAFFARHSQGFDYQRPAGGSVCFPRLRFPEGAAAFCHRLVRAAGIMLVPSGLFGYGDRHVRVGFGRRDLPEVLARFTEYLTD